MKYKATAIISCFTAFFGMILGLNGCDVIDPADRLQNTTSVDSGSMRKVLLEDYTGFLCVNCPQAAEAASNILDIYKDNVIVISVHAGNQFAKPYGSKYTYDFRTPVGEALFPLFIGDAGQPNGTINRKKFDGSYAIYHTDWAAKVATELAAGKADMSIQLKPEYDSTTKILTVSTNVKYKNAGNANHKLAVYLIEDSIVFYQKDIRFTPNDRPDYLHRHVLRGAVGNYGEFGKQISAVAISAGSSFDDSFSVSFAGKDWKPSHCSVVAFVNDSQTYEVLQTEDEKVIIK